MKDEPSFGIIIVCLIATSNDALQLARFYWKMVVDESAQLGVVVIGVNNPHLQEAEVEEQYKLCQSPLVHHPLLAGIHHPNDILKGIMYACTVDEARKFIPEIPSDVTITGVLY